MRRVLAAAVLVGRRFTKPPRSSSSSWQPAAAATAAAPPGTSAKGAGTPHTSTATTSTLTTAASNAISAPRQPQRTLYPRIHLRAATERYAPPSIGKRDDDKTADDRPFPSDSIAGNTNCGGDRRLTSGGKAGPVLQRQPPKTPIRRPAAAPTAFASTAAAGADPGATAAGSISTFLSDNHNAPDTSSPAAGAQQEQLPSLINNAARKTDASASTGATAATTTTAAADFPVAPARNEVRNFLEAVQQRVEQSRHERNQAIPYPKHPDEMVPLFRRLKQHTRMQVVEADPDYPTFPRQDCFVTLPPPGKHPWVKNTPIGHIIHGDGQLGVVGTGEVGFEDSRLKHHEQVSKEESDGEIAEPDDGADEYTLRRRRRGWRGLQHRSLLHRRLPQRNGKVLQEAVIKHSFALTGRGVFATRDVKKGETIMMVESSAQSLGVKGEIRRLEDMVADILRATYEACYMEKTVDLDQVEVGASARSGGAHEKESMSANGNGTGGRHGRITVSNTADGEETSHGDDAKAFLHEWILTGQPSSLLEHFPVESTQRVLDAIGGKQVLEALELHTIHIARLAAIIDLNSFLVESFHAERKGMAYFPEAGFLNHSCEPNATYDIMPEHVFKESDYFLDEAGGGGEDGDVDEDDEHHSHQSTKSVKGMGSKHQMAEGQSSSVAGAASSKAVAHERNALDAHYESEDVGTDYLSMSDALDLTETGAMRYLFCCRAEKDIAAGSEIVISYVPPDWSFDSRQYVLHDRYRFWCKCPRCAPVLEQTYARVPKLLVGIVVLSIMLQGLVFHLRGQKADVDLELQRLGEMSEEERIEELRSRGIDLEDIRMDAKMRAREEAGKPAKKKRMGLFEAMERERLRQAYDIEGALNGNDPYLNSQNPYPNRPPGL